MNRKIIYAIFGLALLALRLMFNFSFDLIPGINGGYYPVQVRAVLETGSLGFPDMPLCFYLNAAIVKVFSLFSVAGQDRLIITTLKIIDSISVPLLVIPLFLIRKHVFSYPMGLLTEVGMVAFATLSVSPLLLTSDLQKNAMAIPLFMFFIYFLLLFYTKGNYRNLAGALFFLFLIAIIHFGVFSIAMLFLVLGLLTFYGRKAIFSVLAIVIAGLLIILIFDAARASRLLFVFVGLVAPPRLYMFPVSPFEVFNDLFSWFLAGLGLYVFRKHKSGMNRQKRSLVLVFSMMLIILSLPVLNIEYARRFSLHLFIFQIFLILNVFPVLSATFRTTISAILLLVALASGVVLSARLKPPSITREAFEDMKNLEVLIAEPKKTLVVARHGLEWWTAWQLQTKVAQAKAVDSTLFDRYKKIIVLQQKSGINQTYPGGKDPFPEPQFEMGASPFYNSDYFRATVLTKADFK